MTPKSTTRRDLALLLWCAAIVPAWTFAATPALLPPRLLGVDTNGSETLGFALPDAALHVPVSALRLRFDQAVMARPEDLRLLGAGPDGRIDSVDCSSAPLGDDAALMVRDIGLFAAPDLPFELAATFGDVAGLPAGDYRLLVCDTLQGTNLLALDGDDDGLPGGGTPAFDFRIAETPQLANPGFATGIEGWSVGDFDLSRADVTHSPLDADGSPSSGGVRIAGPGGVGVTLVSSCVTEFHHTYRVRFRYRVLQGNVRITAALRHGFAGDTGEPDCVGPETERFDLEAPPSAPGLAAVFDSGRRRAEHGGPRAQLQLQISSQVGPPFEVVLDDIGFSIDPNAVFHSRFE